MFTVLAHRKYLDFSPVIAMAKDRATADSLFDAYKGQDFTQIKIYDNGKLVWSWQNPTNIARDVAHAQSYRDLVRG